MWDWENENYATCLSGHFAGKKNDNRKPSVTELQQLAKLFDMSVDDILNYEGEAIPKDVTMENKAGFEQINLINQLDEDDKVTVFKTIDTMLTKKKFKDFFNKNIAALKSKKMLQLIKPLRSNLLKNQYWQIHR